MGRVSHLGPSWHGPSFIWAELVGAELVLVRVVLHPTHTLLYIYLYVTLDYYVPVAVEKEKEGNLV